MRIYLVKKVKIEGCERNNPTDFQKLGEAEFMERKGSLQQQTIPVKYLIEIN